MKLCWAPYITDPFLGLPIQTDGHCQGCYIYKGLLYKRAIRNTLYWDVCIKDLLPIFLL